MKVADIEYKAVFVPFSRSRNAKSNDLSLNWKITIKYNGKELTTDYQQGIGYNPGYKGIYNIDEVTALKLEAEQGRTVLNTHNFLLGRPLKPPLLNEVLFDLLSDGEAIDYPSYEEWAKTFGYDEDSRKGEKIYQQCLSIGLKLRSMFGERGLNELREEIASNE